MASVVVKIALNVMISVASNPLVTRRLVVVRILDSDPIPSMYGIFPYIWLIFMVNVGKNTKHGSYGN